MCAKMAKLPQTDWTRGGHEISQTAIPLYKENLTRMGDYLADPMAYQQEYLDRFYNADNIRNQDFLKALKRAMGNTTANNWAATTGGYTSAGNRSYNDRQKHWNDLASRLADYGITSSYDMASQDFQNMRGANADYNAAYELGKNYSAIETQNYLADKQNKNWWAGALKGAGQAIGSIPHPVTMAIGSAMTTAGELGSKDFSSAYAGMDGIYGTHYSQGNVVPAQNGTFSNIFGDLKNTGALGSFQNWAGGKMTSMFGKGKATGVTPQITK